MNVDVERTRLNGVFILTPRRIGDARGWFSEVWNKRTFAQIGVEIDFVQDNHSLSAKVGTIRGLHFQAPPHAQAKLVRCGRGRFLDVVVDIRKGSPTFGGWIGVELSFENGRQLLIPKGFAHGFVTREPDTEIVYKCSDFYAPASECAIRWDDPELAIDWGLGGVAPHLSERDRAAPCLSDIESPFLYEKCAA